MKIKRARPIKKYKNRGVALSPPLRGRVRMLGLYIHVPFCASKCAYCDFYSLAAADEKAMDAYVAALCAHLMEYGAVCAQYRVDTVYFGGGTPSLLGAKRLKKLIGEIRRHFTVEKDAEITVECNPDSMTKPLLRGLRRAGANRLSVGVQSACDQELRRLGRAHTWAQAIDALTLAKKMHFHNISVDLMYGLPGQSVTDFLQSVRAVLALAPAHLSCYGLKLEPDTPMWREAPALPDDDAQADLYLALCGVLKAAGYCHYEVSNWAKPGMQSRHNSKYWDLSEYLGLGPGAHSYMNGRRFAFVRDLAVYCAGVRPDGSSIVADEDDVATMQRHGEYLMLRLRTAQGVEQAVFESKFKREFAPYADRLRPLARGGLAGHDPDAGRWYLTEQGFLVSNSIICETLSADEATLRQPAAYSL